MSAIRRNLLSLLACPHCEGELCVAPVPQAQEDLESGELRCDACRAVFPIRDGIPRFVPNESYGTSFGLQWNRFRTEQLDSVSGLALSRDRFESETGLTAATLTDRVVLDAGCGAGRFLDVSSLSNAEVIGVDLTSAVDAARQSLGGRKNVHFVQASIYELPFKPGTFDACYCIGVIQHTPDPQSAIAALPRVLRSGGTLALTTYERRPWTGLNGKYVIRRVSRRVPPLLLLLIVSLCMPALFVATDVLYRIPFVGRLLAFLIPVANYVHEPQLSAKQRYRWALMDTFDMLAPAFDTPQKLETIAATLEEAGMVRVRRLSNPGLNVVAEKRAERDHSDCG